MVYILITTTTDLLTYTLPLKKSLTLSGKVRGKVGSCQFVSNHKKAGLND